MAKRDILSKIANELSKYQIRILGLSLLPFAVSVGIYYLPTGKQVGYIKWAVFREVEGEIVVELDEKKYYIRYKEGRWTISEQS